MQYKFSVIKNPWFRQISEYTRVESSELYNCVLNISYIEITKLSKFSSDAIVKLLLYTIESS